MKSIYRHIAILSIVAFVLMQSSCYREKPIQSEIGKPRYQVDANIPEILDLYNTSGVQMIYDFDGAIAKWNLGKLSSKGLYIPINKEDPEAMASLKANLSYILDEFVNLYPKEFQKKYMPLRIFLCDSIKGVRFKNIEEFAYYGIDHIAINLYKKGDKVNGPDGRAMTFNDIDAYYDAAFLSLHTTLFQQLSVYKAEWSHAFLSINEGMYNVNLVKREDEPDFDPRKYGFWTYDEDYAGWAWYHTVTVEKDISDFIERFITKSESENLSDMESFPLLRQKYDILRAFIKDNFGVDMQEIGNKRSNQ
ncbi:MAG: putative zinc-binding metallopeptidase [Porphyromonas somerae]|uniref:putative zinc-binding metallopeptidase n=1 Tax=Porphyromonas somerae TaxID=322095 RepID=UPI0026F14BD9|nr:putative zinc-binding metallopeptidase [Porphyromonas somerae]MDD7557873.1 putative zinc-binding metallopeptidase [Porphyromonas somerae]MDY5816156.1 putative zinc-binding metallopeptidase [Porphyromonas somerae]